MSRCLIIGCSRTKNESPGLLSAIERYDGPEYRVIRRFLGEAPTSPQLDMFILSAEFGLIPATKPIPTYDRLMTPYRADELQLQVHAAVSEHVRPQNYSELLISMGKVYRSALAGIENDLGPDTKVVVSDGSTGQKLTKLKAWLWGAEPEVASTPTQRRPGTAVKPRSTPQEVTLRGQTIRLTTDEALSILQSALHQNWDAAHSIRNWFVDVAGERLSPKWAASHLFDLSVSTFSADEARRVLALLGMECHQL